MALSINVYHHLSPRLVEVLSETLAPVQDVHDVIRAWEDSEEGMGYDLLIDSAGKEALGGGVSVGVTSTLQNSQIAFTPQTVSKSEGTCTTADATGTKLIDSAATFVADGVEPGATVINFADRSAGTVLSVDSEIQLTLLPMDDGTDNQWEIGDAYKVWNTVQCEIAEGNVVAVDGDGNELPAIFPTAFTQVLRTLASGGTISSLDTEQIAGDVWDEDAASHVAAGTFGEKNQKVVPSETIADYKADLTGLALEATSAQILSAVEFIEAIEGGRWKIVDDQMIFYKADNITEVARFDLKDVAGAPTSDPAAARERVRV